MPDRRAPDLDRSPPDDSTRVARIGSDPAALEAFYRTYVDDVIAYFARRCSDPHDVADLTAETAPGGEAGQLPPDSDLRHLVEGQVDVYPGTALEELGRSLSLVRLMSPSDVVAHAELATDKIWDAETALMDERDAGKSSGLATDASAAAKKARDLMRRDLGVDRVERTSSSDPTGAL